MGEDEKSDLDRRVEAERTHEEMMQILRREGKRSRPLAFPRAFSSISQD